MGDRTVEEEAGNMSGILLNFLTKELSKLVYQGIV